MNTHSKIYGFEVTNKKGLGFTVWFNYDGSRITDNINGTLPINLEAVYMAQKQKEGFLRKLKYARSAAMENELNFRTLGEQEYKQHNQPVKSFFKSLFKRKSK